MTRFRGGTNSLRVETGRWEKRPDGGRGLALQARWCQQCYSGVEDEVHVLLHCGLYADLRDELKERMHE